jgi:ABC-type lipoprotein export system ATPase subunit
MLVVDDLKKGFGSGSSRLEVLKGVSMEMKPGELVALMGPSGCGKSTLLNIISPSHQKKMCVYGSILTTKKNLKCVYVAPF